MGRTKAKEKIGEHWKARTVALEGADLVCVLTDGRRVRVGLAKLGVKTRPKATAARVDAYGHGIVLTRSDGSEDDLGVDLVRYHLDAVYRKQYEGKGPTAEELAVRVGERVRARREEMGLTQKELARRVGMAIPNYSRIETGKHLPTLDKVLEVAKALGTTVDGLVGEKTGR